MKLLTPTICVLLGLVMASATPCQAQISIGGPFGVNIGGGRGVSIGGPYGVQVGRGRGANIGGPYGVQVGGGAGARFGGPNGVWIGNAQEMPETPVANDLHTPRGERDQEHQLRGDRRRVSIYYPAEASRELHFRLNATPFVVHPGQTIRFSSEEDWAIHFRRGDGRGEVSYRLVPGNYQFHRQETGWDLFVVRPEVPPAEELPIPAPAR